jgi:hypothetical protein
MGFDCLSVKNRAMEAEAAEYGLVLWDGKSTARLRRRPPD